MTQSHRFLDSAAPFRPINPWGQTPKPVRPIHDERVALYQLEVDWNGKAVRVGPKMLKAAIEDILVEVNKLIIDGKERAWSNPRLVRH